MDYFGFISLSIIDDRVFEDQLETAWSTKRVQYPTDSVNRRMRGSERHLVKDQVYPALKIADPVNRGEGESLEKLREILCRRGTRVMIALRRQLQVGVPCNIDNG